MAGGPGHDDKARVIAALVAAGDYLGAAKAAHAAGDLRRAVQLYERVWRFSDALAVAEELGDAPLSVRLALDAALPARALAIAAAIPDGEAALLRAVAEVFAARGRLLEAAALFERAGLDARAAELYRRGGALIEAARALVRAGQWTEAGRLYDEIAGAAESQGDVAGQAEARLELGILCARLGRPRDAARALQIAARQPGTALGALAALSQALGALGLQHAALLVAERLATQAGTTPAPLPGLGNAAPVADAGRLPRFSDLALIGVGRLGRVYRARDRLLDDTVVLKVLGVGASGHGSEERAFRQFLREAEASSRLRHDNIVRLFDVDQRAGLLVLEYLPGGTLADRIAAEGALRPAAVRRVALDLLGALDAAHRAGIIHRDVKPANIFLDAAGNAKLADFGASHLADFGGTQTAGFIGTLGYLSPEQISGGTIGPAADLYGLGVTLFQALTGQLPFLGPDIAGQHLSAAPPEASARVPGLDAAHDEVLKRAMAKNPGARFPSAQAMAAAVRAWPTELALPDRLADPGARPRARTPGPAPLATPAPVRIDASATPVGATTRGELFLRTDERLGHPVLVEVLATPLGEAELAALARLAATGGPCVQRVLRLEGEREIIYESVKGDLVPWAQLHTEEAAALANARVELAALGIAPGPHTPVCRTAGGPVILVVAAREEAYSAHS